MYQEKLMMLLVPLSCPPCSVIAVIAATLFPLWPAEMRVGVYYLSVGAGCFVASILLLAVGECRQAGSERAEAQPSSSPGSELGGAASRDVVQPQPDGSCVRFPPASGCHGCATGRERAQAVSPVGVSCVVQICILPLVKQKSAEQTRNCTHKQI